MYQAIDFTRYFVSSVDSQDFNKVCKNNKGLGDSSVYKDSGWNVKAEQVSLPSACLYQSRLSKNIQWMAQFAQQSQVFFAPHGKTTMCPDIFKQQLAAGAYAITVANAQQALVAKAAGAKNILMANQLVGLANMQKIAELLLDLSGDFFCLVDNVDNVSKLGDFFTAKGLSVKVLIELGIKKGRCGVNDEKRLLALIAHIKAYPALKLAGIEVYEGVLEHKADVEAFLKNAIDQCQMLMTDHAFDSQEVIITAGGSAWYDVVCKVFTQAERSNNMKMIIRPGCYVAHDQGIYEQAQQGVLARSELAGKIENELSSCLEIFAYVQSLPESGRAVIGMGKRDVAFDAGMPTPNTHINQQGEVNVVPSSWRVEKVMDQHAMLTYDSEELKLTVGDIISFGSSHPCLTFDKWRYINLMDDNFNVIDVYKTYF